MDGNVEAVIQFLDSGISVDAVVEDYGVNETPLMWASIRSKNLPVVRLLLERGATVDFQNTKGGTALHDAAKANNPEIVSLLLEYGANRHLTNKRGETALDLALKRGHSEVIAVLSKTDVT